MPSTLYHHGVIHSRTDPFAQALVVADGVVAWLGSDDSVSTVVDGVDEVVDLDGALVTPGFVDAHVHVLETGLALIGLDLSARGGRRDHSDRPDRPGGPTSLAQVLEAVAAAAVEARRTADGPLLGHGWDEAAWPEGRPPTRAELDRAADGGPVHLVHADRRRAVVSSAFADVSGVAALEGWDDGLLMGPAFDRAWAVSRDLAPGRRDRALRAALAAAAGRGVVSVHEHSAPDLDTREGLLALLELTRSPLSGLPGVVGLRAELCETSDDARDLLAAVPGLSAIGGCLRVDGTLTAHGAALRRPYADAATSGDLVLTAEQVANHVAAVTRAGSRAALHVTGDRALEEVLLGIRAAEDVEGLAAVRGAGHRLEHVPMVDAAALAAMVLLGLRASLQPALGIGAGTRDATLELLGPARVASLHPVADLAGAGVPLAFGSGSPASPIDPWGAIRAAIEHPEESQRVSARAAFRAHTRGGWRLADLDGTGAGEIRLGAPASLAVWEAGPLAVQAPDGRVSAWSTDPRAGTPLLPELGDGLPEPVCLRTLRDGVVLHDRLG